MDVWSARPRLETALGIVIALALALVVLRNYESASAPLNPTWQLVWSGPAGERYYVDQAQIRAGGDSVAVIAWDIAPQASYSFRHLSSRYIRSRDAFVVDCRSLHVDGSRTSSMWRGPQRLYDLATAVFSGSVSGNTSRAAGVRYACSHRGKMTGT